MTLGTNTLTSTAKAIELGVEPSSTAQGVAVVLLSAAPWAHKIVTRSYASIRCADGAECA